MPQEVQLQSDLGALSLQGLGAFTSILAILSADDIAPVALLQIEKLGAVFPTSGPCAEKVKGLLQRCSSVRLDRLSMAVGWRKNDTASLMGASAGGQAASLLCLCLSNVLKYEDVGLTLSQLSKAMLSRDNNLAAVSQLAATAKMLSGKLSAIGFGNHLAREVKRIMDSYEAMGKKAPENLLDRLNTESLLEILQLSSKALLEDHNLCRIKGSQSMGLIGGLLQILFHEDLSISIEGVEIQAATKPKILLEVFVDEESTTMYLVAQRHILQEGVLPIRKFDTSERYHPIPNIEYNWNGWLADNLVLTFSNWGLRCNQSILDACHQLVLQLGSLYSVAWTEDGVNVPLRVLLGNRMLARLQRSCEAILRSSQSADKTLQEAFDHLQELMNTRLAATRCSCTRGQCDDSLVDISKSFPFNRKYCVRFQVWSALSFTIASAIGCAFVNAGQNSVVRPTELLNNENTSRMSVQILKTQKKKAIGTIYMGPLWGFVMEIVAPERLKSQSLAVSSAGCTIFPSILQSFCVPRHQEVTFDLIEGQLIFENRYHNCLEAEEVSERDIKRFHPSSKPIEPSGMGRHVGEPFVTIQEKFDCLELSCSIKYQGVITQLDIKKVTEGYLDMYRSDACPHSSSQPLPNDNEMYMETDVAEPIASDGLTIVMTRGSPVAQFLACVNGYQAVLVRDSCLSCATRQYTGDYRIVFIVG